MLFLMRLCFCPVCPQFSQSVCTQTVSDTFIISLTVQGFWMPEVRAIIGARIWYVCNNAIVLLVVLHTVFVQHSHSYWPQRVGCFTNPTCASARSFQIVIKLSHDTNNWVVLDKIFMITCICEKLQDIDRRRPVALTDRHCQQVQIETIILHVHMYS
jgi:hypothetical protein